MALSLAAIIVLGLIFKWFFEKIKLPGILGMLFLGILIGPFGFNIINSDLMNVSSDLRKIALIVILLRAGLGISKKTLVSVGKSAFKMSFIPDIIEGFSVALFSVIIFKFSFIQGGILGFIIAAVSPAVVVPGMLDLISKGKGQKKSVPTIIIAGASVDDVVSITIFSTFLGLYGGSSVNIPLKIIEIPFSIVFGIIIGIISGLFLVFMFKKHSIRDTKKVLYILAISIFMTSLEDVLKSHFQIASLIGVMAMGFIILEKAPQRANNIAKKLEKIWVFAEIMLFVLVGAQVNVNVVLNSGLKGLLLILIGLIFRSIGVLIALMGSGLNTKEKIFSVVAYIPKATVQAAIGAIPFSMGVAGGDVMLAVAVLAIIVTAPIGAFGIKILGEKFLD